MRKATVWFELDWPNKGIYEMPDMWQVGISRMGEDTFMWNYEDTLWSVPDKDEQIVE